VVAGLQAGAERCARLLASEPVALHWQPRAYRTEAWYSEAPVRSPGQADMMTPATASKGDRDG
jgi:predicted component of type VI protein secretion system